jgi:hypothetical protein
MTTLYAKKARIRWDIVWTRWSWGLIFRNHWRPHSDLEENGYSRYRWIQNGTGCRLEGRVRIWWAGSALWRTSVWTGYFTGRHQSRLSIQNNLRLSHEAGSNGHTLRQLRPTKIIWSLPARWRLHPTKICQNCDLPAIWDWEVSGSIRRVSRSSVLPIFRDVCT